MEEWERCQVLEVLVFPLVPETLSPCGPMATATHSQILSLCLLKGLEYLLLSKSEGGNDPGGKRKFCDSGCKLQTLTREGSNSAPYPNLTTTQPFGD